MGSGSAPLDLSLTLSDTQIADGEPLEMALSVRNTGEDTIAVVIGKIFIDGEEYNSNDFVVLRSDSSFVWNKRPDLIVGTGYEFLLEPGQSETMKYTWNLRDESGKSVKGGSYYVFGGVQPYLIYKRAGHGGQSLEFKGN